MEHVWSLSQKCACSKHWFLCHWKTGKSNHFDYEELLFVFTSSQCFIARSSIYILGRTDTVISIAWIVDCKTSVYFVSRNLHIQFTTWWRLQMETFSALLAICAGNSPVPGEFPTQRPVTRSFDVYFDLRPNKRLGKQSLGWWFETLSPPLWRHRNEIQISQPTYVSTMQRRISSHWLNAYTKCAYIFPGMYCICAQPMRDDVAMQRRLSLAGRIYKMIPERRCRL